MEVYNGVLFYWIGALRSDKPFKRFINALGIEYSQLQNSSYDGVDNVYFKLEPYKYSYTAPEKSAIVSDLNSVFSVNDEFELYIHYSGQTKRVVSNHWKQIQNTAGNKISDYTIDTVGIRATLHSDPIKYFANASLASAGVLTIRSNNNIFSRISQTAARTSPRSTPVTSVKYNKNTTHIYATLALLDNGSMFTRQGGIYDERTTVTKTTNSDVYFEYSYKVKYKVTSIATTDSYIVNQIDLVSNAMQNALRYKGSNIYAIANSASDTTLKEAVVAMNNVEAIGLTYNGFLRVDAVAMMKRKEFVNMLSRIIGAGYTESESKWYEKAIAVIVILVAIVVFVYSGGVSAATSGNLVVLSESLAATTAVLTIGMTMYAAAFPRATDQTRMIGKYAQIVGIAAMVTGVAAAIQTSWQRMVTQEAARQMAAGATEQQAAAYVAKLGIMDFIQFMVENAVNSIKSSIMSSFSSITQPSTWSLPSLSEITLTDVSGWLRNMNTAMEQYMKFFGDSKQYSTATEDEQAKKEDGVSSVYLAYTINDRIDALERMDNMIKDNLGGQKTENFLVQIT